MAKVKIWKESKIELSKKELKALRKAHEIIQELNRDLWNEDAEYTEVGKVVGKANCYLESLLGELEDGK